jgi:hypothetical protein
MAEPPGGLVVGHTFQLAANRRRPHLPDLPDLPGRHRPLRPHRRGGHGRALRCSGRVHQAGIIHQAGMSM